MDENFKQLIDELKQEVIESIEDTTNRTRVACLDTLKNAEELMNIPQCKQTIWNVINTIRRILNHINK